jgi:hypothetical protein
MDRFARVSNEAKPGLNEQGPSLGRRVRAPGSGAWVRAQARDRFRREAPYGRILGSGARSISHLGGRFVLRNLLCPALRSISAVTTDHTAAGGGI